jgi:hypothetical protein
MCGEPKFGPRPTFALTHPCTVTDFVASVTVLFRYTNGSREKTGIGQWIRSSITLRCEAAKSVMKGLQSDQVYRMQLSSRAGLTPASS